jgi:hypothetical protein
LLALPTPEATLTHKPVSHASLVEAVVEALAFRHIDVVRDEYAITADSMRMFGFLELNMEEGGIRFALGLRNSHDKSFALGITVGYRVFVCDNLAFHGDFAAVTKRHSKNINIVELVAVGIDRAQRHFEPMKKDIQVWQNHELPDVRAKEVIYDAFIGSSIDAPKHLAKVVHQHYFQPTPAFEPRNLWSLSNAFTTSFKELEPVAQMRAAASLAPFIQHYQ